MRRQLGGKDIVRDAHALRALLNSVPGVTGVTDHGTLLGLGDDDHSQYAGIAQAEVITGAWTFNTNVGAAGGVTFDGVDISVHAADADAHHAGFTGLEDTAATAVTPAADDHIQFLNGGSLSIAAGSNVMTFSLLTPGTLSVTSANTQGNHTHAITSSSNPGTAAAILATDSSGLLQLRGLGIGAAAVANVIVMADGAAIGQSAGPLITFDDTLNFLEITGAKVGLGVTNPQADLDILLAATDVTGGIRMQSSLADATTKAAKIKLGHYTNAEEPVTLFGISSISSASNLFLGGGFTDENSATNIVFYVAANNTTLTGTETLRVNGATASISVGGIGTPGAKVDVLGATGAQLRLRQAASVLADFTVDSGGNLTIAPTGDFIFNPTGNDILPTTGYDLNLGSLQKKYLTLHAAELWVETLVAQDTIATIGGRILVTPTTELIADMLAAATSMDVKHNQMANGDRVLMQAQGKLEWIAITSSATVIAGGYRYATITRNLDGTGANDWYAGDAVVNTGQAGGGFIDLYSLSSVNGRILDYIYNADYAAGVPVFSGNYADVSRWRPFDDGANTEVNDAIYFGIANTSWSNLFFFLGTAAAYSGSLVWEYFSGAGWSPLSTTEETNFTATGQSQVLFSSAQVGWAATTVNGVSAFWIRCRISAFTSWTTLPIQISKRVITNESQFGPSVVGFVRNSGTFNDFTERWAIGNLNGLYGYGVDTYGVAMGGYAAATPHLTIEPTNGLRIFSGLSTVIGQWDNSGNITVGQVAASQDNIYITAGAINLRNNTTTKIQLQADGDVFIGTDISAAATTVFAIFTNAQTYNSESVGAGDLLIGDNSASKANVLWDKSAGQMLFRGGTTTQAYIDTDGTLAAGAGNVKLNSSGLQIADGAGDINGILWTGVASAKPQVVSNNGVVHVMSTALTTLTSGNVIIQALTGATTSEAEIFAYAVKDSGASSIIYFEINNTAELSVVPGYVWAANDIRVGGGLYVGSTATDPTADEIWLDRLINFRAEITTPAGAANQAKLYAKDNGSGKTQLCVIFGSGAEQVLATEP